MTMHRFSGIFLLMILATSQGTTLAQTAVTNLSGAWKMNAAKSRLPKASQIQSELLVVKQDGSEIELDEEVDGKQSVEKYTTDKKEKVIREVPAAGSKIVAKAYWKGAMLVVETKAVFSMSSPLGSSEMMHTKDSWTLSADGLVLTEKSVWDDGQSVTVFDKQ
jgi:hypothetical protein